ncbi:MAG: hypothetical protein KDK41_11940 [Leptospiraceae bacterium]|nr:hypothetical protein [Leptospiraceae bacterium]
MRGIHIDYLKAMRTAAGFTGKLLEIAPRADEIMRQIPVAVIYPRPVVNQLDARVLNRVKRLPSLQNQNGTKDLKYVKRHFKQEYRYQVAFFLKGDSIEAELMSSHQAPGIIDKCLKFISDNQYITTGNTLAQIGVDVGPSGIIEDEADKDVFKAFVDVIFRDGVYEEELERTLAGGTLEIELPVLINQGA